MAAKAGYGGDQAAEKLAPEAEAAVKNYETLNLMEPGTATLEQVQKDGGVSLWGQAQTPQEKFALRLCEMCAANTIDAIALAGEKYKEMFKELVKLSEDFEFLNQLVCDFAKEFKPTNLKAFQCVVAVRRACKELQEDQIPTMKEYAEDHDWDSLREMAKELEDSFAPPIQEFQEMTAAYTALLMKGQAIEAEADKNERTADDLRYKGKVGVAAGAGVTTLATGAAGVLGTVTLVGVTQAWNPVGWVILGSCAVAAVGVGGLAITGVIVGGTTWTLSANAQERISNLSDIMKDIVVLMETHSKQLVVLTDNLKAMQKDAEKLGKIPNTKRLQRILDALSEKVDKSIVDCDNYIQTEFQAQMKIMAKLGLTYTPEELAIEGSR